VFVIEALPNWKEFGVIEFDRLQPAAACLEVLSLREVGFARTSRWVLRIDENSESALEPSARVGQDEGVRELVEFDGSHSGSESGAQRNREGTYHRNGDVSV